MEKQQEMCEHCVDQYGAHGVACEQQQAWQPHIQRPEPIPALCVGVGVFAFCGCEAESERERACASAMDSGRGEAAGQEARTGARFQPLNQGRVVAGHVAGRGQERTAGRLVKARWHQRGGSSRTAQTARAREGGRRTPLHFRRTTSWLPVSLTLKLSRVALRTPGPERGRPRVCAVSSGSGGGRSVCARCRTRMGSPRPGPRPSTCTPRRRAPGHGPTRSM